MTDDLGDLARTAADTLVAAMTTDSWAAVKRRFAALVGHERRMDTAHDELSAKAGPAREQERQVQARDWSIRLRDVLEEDPAAVAGLRALLAELGPAPAPIIAPAFQQARADRGSQAVNVSGSFSGNTGEVYVGVGKVDKRRFRFVLVPIGFFGRAIRKLAGAHPVATTAAAAVVIGGITAGVALAKPGATSPMASLLGSWAGTYTCNQGLTGLDMQIAPSADGTVSVLEDFYPVPANPTVPDGSVRFHGTLSGSTVQLAPAGWVEQPSGYFLTPLEGPLPAAGSSVWSGTVIGSGCTTFSVNRVHGAPSASVAAGTWVGTYTCSQGLTGLRLVIRPGGGSKLAAVFNFYAPPADPSVPSGSFTMTGFVDPAGVFLNQGHWISQPPGWSMVSLAGGLPTAGDKTFTGSVVGCSSFALTKTA